MSSDGSVRAEAPDEAAAWQSVPHPVVKVDRSGVIQGLSASARALLTDAEIGTRLADATPWLARAHDRFLSDQSADTGKASTTGKLNGRDFEARPAALAGGEVAWWLVEDAHRSLWDVQQELARERKRAALLDDVSAVLMASLNLERCMEATAQMADRHLADAAVVVAPVRGARMPVVCSGPDGAAEHRSVDADPAEVSGLGEALRGFPPVPSRWIDPASLPDWLIPSHFVGQVGSVLITPLPGHGVPAGALVLLRRDTHTVFTESEERFARLFATRAGAALSAARLYAEQSAITRTLMRDLMPPQLGPNGDFELAGGYRASADHEFVGGDFYDVHPAADPNGETLVVLGDVCGKGLEAAVLSGKIRNTLQALAPLADQHEAVLKLLNSALLTPDNSRFATMVLASVARREGQLRLRLTCAGHPPPLIVRNDGTVEQADTRGMLVGALPQFKARSTEVSLAPGETCLLYTDGLSEARGGPLGQEAFGDERLIGALAQCAELPAEAVVERMMMLASEWVTGREHDDMAVVAITAPRRTHLSAVDGHTAGRYIA
ncbi:serine/threonine protein phosphatase [Mycolicibacterium novocastrense]|uniref:PP2C family protein-serine/threonine phosphatase n=1 Tax=Mycolicibacterium novocastrense TaxID=59813 RepID=UPI000746E634|nr:SpoIIE family protein phosphatase [Mycolicibacterium novocastrense]KUH70949.1 serine/threonine protein phosphatase [Mycolicibacterium novocastrense]KUH72789.1 serine/threonine protein phosphatase [Mycolicibacterium novocastrense]KUH76968.1 serine/threonine protein phosphatase [Mycolicibacterium novocastrense]